MSDNLRNRIADVVYETLNIWEPLGEDDESSFVAQAIIDDLGLRVETEPPWELNGATPANPGLAAWKLEKRVVGKWEKP